jgi:hypothetical protein
MWFSRRAKISLDLPARTGRAGLLLFPAMGKSKNTNTNHYTFRKSLLKTARPSGGFVSFSCNAKKIKYQWKLSFHL